jgi:DNA-binding beta-propeller fold protein YncE
VIAVSRATSIPLLVLLTAPFAPGLARAQSVSLTFAKGIYSDAKEGAIRFPEGVACTDGGDVVVADTGNARLLRFTYKEGELTGGTAIKVPQLAYPTRLQLDSKQNLLVLDGKKKQIARLDPKGAFVGFVDLGDTAVAKVMPVSFKVDAADNLYVLDVVAGKVLVVGAGGAVARRIDLPAGAAGFTDVAVDPAGIVYAVDAVTSTVWSADKGATAFKPLTKSLKESLSFPGYLTVNRGRLFVVDYSGHGIVVLGLDGSYQGRQLSLGAVEGVVYYPTQLCVTEAGSVFVADRSNNRVQVFTIAK